MQETLAAVASTAAQKPEIRPLTGIRGIAASWVVVYHIHQNDTAHGPLSQILMHGYQAVDIFFILSGFVMALTYGHLAENGWTQAKYSKFLIRRLARIYPLYIVLTALMIAATFIGLSDLLPCKSLALSIISNILLIQNWGLCHSYIGPAWSISTELAAYLLFPLLLHRLLKRTSLSAWADLACCLAGLSALCLYPTRPAEFVLHGPLDIWWPQSIWPLVRCLLGFTAGLAAWRLWNDPQVRARFASPSASWLCAGLLIIVLAIPNLDVVFAALSAVFIICLASGDNAVTRLFGSRPAHFIGEISYALYLLHYPLMKLLKAEPKLAPHFGQVPAHILTLAAYAAILFAMSVLAHRFIEVPCRTSLRRLERAL